MMHILTLEKNQNNEGVVFRIQLNHTVRFVIGASLFGEEIKLLVNYPKDDINFVTNNFIELKWINSKSNGLCLLFSDITFKLLGTFKYEFYFKNDNKENLIGNGNFIIETKIKFGLDQELDLDSLRCQTVLSKSLGYFENWKEKLHVAYKSGYNAIHFTPIQELGNSKSSYSIKDHHKLNSMFNLENSSINYDFNNVKSLIDFMQNHWNIISITDIVLNHTANETLWLQEHPECSYNLVNSPHLRPAYLLDRICWHVTMDINSGKWETSGLPKTLNSEDHLKCLKNILKSHYLSLVKIHEMFLIDVDDMSNEFERRFISFVEGSYKIDLNKVEDKLYAIQNNEYRRFKSKVNLNSAIKIISKLVEKLNKDLWIEEAKKIFCQYLYKINEKIYFEIQNHLDCAVENIINTVRYERLDSNGPKIKFVSSQYPIVPPYFTTFTLIDDLFKEEEIIYNNSKNIYIMAHNGWVMDDNPLRNFAEKESNVYLRRELVAWGDCVKLRYGDKPEDCSFLWNFMKKYVEQSAEIFHGIRLDNCHSTPIHVAQYFLDAARKKRPNLIVIAELFTSSEYFDNIFVNKLGINYLIRESVSCPNSQDLGRLLHRFGGNPIGSFEELEFCLFENSSETFEDVKVKKLIPSISRAILYDQTHDNESIFFKRTPFDVLSTAALVSMSCSSIGSNRGYDELVPHHINAVNECRVYANWNEDIENKNNMKFLSYRNGIINARIILNKLHYKLNSKGYTEIYVNQLDFDTVSITRFNPVTMKSVILISRTKFFKDSFNLNHLKFNIDGKVNSILFIMRMHGNPDKYKANEFIINGVEDFKCLVKNNIIIENNNFKSEFCNVNFDNNKVSIELINLNWGSVIAFDVQLFEEQINFINVIRKFADEFYTNNSEIKKIVNSLTLEDLNYVLFKTNQEELDEGFGRKAYDVPNFKTLIYCGLAGLMFHWKNIRTNNDLGHPICDNLRKGDWLPNYISSRLLLRKSTKNLGLWLSKAFFNLKNIPHYLIPKYFDIIFTPLYNILLKHCWKTTLIFFDDHSDIVKKLILGTIALIGFNKSSPLPPLSINISNPKPEVFQIENLNFPLCATISAGLPFFSSNYMRNWGRDTFISLKGCLLITNRFNEARYIILAYANVLRHGLIPNLLNKGLNPRYNCRDGVWWWLQSIKDYCEIVPNGELILKESVNRLYPNDNCKPILNETRLQKLQETVYEALQRHFIGIDFIERNAGKEIDDHMKESGFNIKAGICRETGFPFGGNQFNCGTWMDKMGSSIKAGNKGIPATQRDGTAVELVGLCYSVISWLEKLHSKNIFPFSGVQDINTKLSWNEWKNKLKENFEKLFWVSASDTDSLINQREIYKDSFNSSEKWRDLQLRCNYVITMALAPDLFNKANARKALNNYEKILVSDLGVRTLDSSDWNYNGYYNNSNDSDNFKIAHGFNYHNGPEWIWPMGYYLKARMIFFNLPEDGTKKFVLCKLAKHYEYINSSEYYGLPELTNSNGSICKDSCEIQAWSHGTLLDVLYNLRFFLLIGIFVVFFY